MMNELQAFLDTLRSEVFNRAHAPGQGNFRLAALTEEIFALLEEAAVVPDAHVAFYRHEQGNVHAEMHGYSFDADDDVLSLFYFIDAYEDVALGAPATVVGTRKEEVSRAFRHLEACVRMAKKGVPGDVDEAHPTYELFNLITESLQTHRTIEFHVVTTGTLTDRAAAVDAKEREVRRESWDLLRLQRVCGWSRAEGISVDFVREHENAIPCLATSVGSDGLQVMLACIPAKVLAAIYNTYRSRLLERNVRSFLQFNGKVNKGIRDTIVNHPRRFLAYNNGLAATASRVEVEEVGAGLARIRAVHDFQIVNGGQTTASIASCARRDDSDLSVVSVAMKLTVVPAEQVDGLVGLISKYANTQNRIQEADFSANHPWHIALERLSRASWTAPTSDSPRGTRWYYERSRGQYADELAANPTAAGRRKFRIENPSAQKFTKTDLAKVLLAWEERPALVSRGAQKSFLEFMGQITRESGGVPEQGAFHRIIALMIVFQSAETLYGELGYQGLRAQAVAYSVARLSHALRRQLPWGEIWNKQAVPDWLKQALKVLLIAARDVISHPPDSQKNPTEWCKKEECWHGLLERDISLKIPAGLGDAPTGSAAPAVLAAADALFQTVRSIPEDVWFTAARWAKETDSLHPWQRSLAVSLGILARRGRLPSSKQTVQGGVLLLDAHKQGFVHEKLTATLISRLSSVASISSTKSAQV